MNILVVALHGYYANYRSSFVHNQARAYAALGHRVRSVVLLPVMKRPDEGKRLTLPITFVEKDGVEICYIRFLSLSNLGTNGFNTASQILAVKLFGKTVVKDFVPDVIHAHTVGIGGNLGGLFKEICGVPLVITTHGSDTLELLEQGKQDELKKYCDQADVLVAVSSALGEKLARCKTETPIRCILNGFSVQKSQGLSKRPYSLIQVGRLIPQKHVDMTIRAVAALREDYPDIHLEIVGVGSEEGTLRDLCDELGITKDVSFTGMLPNGEVLAHMEQAEIFCMPSYPEGFGIVYLEAMASGCLTIGTQGEGIADLIRDGENGFLVPRDDVEAVTAVIREAFQRPEETHKIAETGRMEARKLTWEYNAETYIELFRKLPRNGAEWKQ